MPSPTQARGADQEARAESELSRRGYVVVERNWRGGGGEIDRIAWDGEILCFVEVRSRVGDAGGSPLESISASKRRHLVRAAQAYLMRFPETEMPMARFDVMGITERPGQPTEVVLVTDAFDAGGRIT